MTIYQLRYCILGQDLKQYIYTYSDKISQKNNKMLKNASFNNPNNTNNNNDTVERPPESPRDFGLGKGPVQVDKTRKNQR